MKRKTPTALMGFVLAVMLCLGAVHARAAETLDEAIIEACIYNCEMDVSEFTVTQELLDERFHALFLDGSLPWYTTSAYTYSYHQENGAVLTFAPNNLDMAQYDYSRYEQRLDEILEQTVFPGMSEWQIALSIHDYLAVNCAYDERLELRTGYDLLIGGSAVCSGYAEAYQELLQRAGVPCVIVTSEAMEHQWNLVCLNGNWYHVDVTWDDPVSNVQGYVSHRHFLRTDTEISAGEDPHHGWKTEYTCDDTAFSQAFWGDVRSAVVFGDEQDCYLIRNGTYGQQILRRDAAGEETLLLAQEQVYMDIGQGSCGYSHFGLTMRDGRLWFTDSAAVYSMNPDGSGLTTEYAYDYASNGMHILGCHAGEDTLAVTLRSHEDDRTDLLLPLEPVQRHIHTYTETVTAPTCVTPGVTVYSCPCGRSGESDRVGALGHSYRVDAHKRQSFFAEGYTKYTCTVCGEQNTQFLPKISFVQWLDETGLRSALRIMGGCFLLAWILSPREKRSRKKTAGNRER